jgi:hypothetical protein
MSAFRDLYKSRKVDFSIQISSDRLSDCLCETGEGAFISSVIHPTSPFFRLNQPGAAEEIHVVRHGRLGQPNGSLDIAGTQPSLVGSDQPAGGLSARSQKLEDLQTRWITQGLEDRHELWAAFHRSKTIDTSCGPVKSGARHFATSIPVNVVASAPQGDPRCRSMRRLSKTQWWS